MFIVIAALVLICSTFIEIRSIQQYQRSELRVSQRAIKYLERIEINHPQLIVIKWEEVLSFTRNEELSRRVWDWFQDYLSGQLNSTEDVYEAQLQKNRFVLLQYPGVLARAVPRSSLSFVPTLLTAIGLIGTFYGISTGLSKFSLGDINDSGKLMQASIGVLAGMKTAFLSSLFGLSSATIFMLVLAVSAAVRRKYRDDLRWKLDKIAVVSRAKDSDQIAAQALGSAADVMKELSPQAIGREIGVEPQPRIEFGGFRLRVRNSFSL